MSRALLVVVGLAVLGAAVFMLIELRSSGPSPELPPPNTETTAPQTRVTPPPPPPETRKPRPPIPTRPREEAIKPAVSSTPPETSTPESRAEAAALIRDASDAYAHERFSEALEIAEKSLAIDDKQILARSLGVLSACALGRADRASEILAGLDERRRSSLIDRCRLEYDVELAED